MRSQWADRHGSTGWPLVGNPSGAKTGWRCGSCESGGLRVTTELEAPMIDETFLLPLELCVLALLIAVGIWRIYRTRHSAAIAASAPVARDMRHDGQHLGT